MLTNDDQKQVEEIRRLQSQILRRLDELGFDGDPDASGNIAHHLAELVVWAKKLSSDTLPDFLEFPIANKDELAELVVGLHEDVWTMKNNLEDLQPALLKLMNHITA
jgi:hypothetical protein